MCLGIPGRVVEAGDGTTLMARVELSGTVRSVNVALVWDDGLAAGDWVLVHAGLALNKMDEAEASEMLAALREISDAYLDETRMEDAGEPALPT